MILLWVAFSLGLTGSLHCVGMCGPLAFTMSSKNSSKEDILFNTIKYHGGRLMTYILMGSVIGTFSHLFLLSGFQKSVSIIGGVFLVLLAIFSTNLDTTLSNNIFGAWLGKISSSFHTLLYKKNSKPSVILLGMLNGILPCGLVYIALAGAATSGNWLSGSLFMGSFGLGTLPLLILSTYFSGKYSFRFPGLFQRVLPGITLIIGIMMIARGFLINTPLTLSFMDALRNPVMCH